MKEVMAELAKLGKEIDAAKSNVSQLEGRKVEIVKRLQEEYGVSTVAESDTKIATMTGDLEKIQGEILADYADLKDKFQW